MKKIPLIAVCALLSACSLAGPGGQEHQTKAQKAAPALPGQLAQVPGPDSSGSDVDYRPDQIRNQNNRSESQFSRIESDSQDNTDELPEYRRDLNRWSVDPELPIYRQDLYRWSQED